MSHITPFTRCVGRRDLRADGSVCPVRESCGRFQALQAGGILVVDARALLCTSPDFEHRTKPARIAPPQCGSAESENTVRCPT